MLPEEKQKLLDYIIILRQRLMWKQISRRRIRFLLNTKHGLQQKNQS